MAHLPFTMPFIIFLPALLITGILHSLVTLVTFLIVLHSIPFLHVPLPVNLPFSFFFPSPMQMLFWSSKARRHLLWVWLLHLQNGTNRSSSPTALVWELKRALAVSKLLHEYQLLLEVKPAKACPRLQCCFIQLLCTPQPALTILKASVPMESLNGCSHSLSSKSQNIAVKH